MITFFPRHRLRAGAADFHFNSAPYQPAVRDSGRPTKWDPIRGRCRLGLKAYCGSLRRAISEPWGPDRGTHEEPLDRFIASQRSLPLLTRLLYDILISPVAMIHVWCVKRGSVITAGEAVRNTTLPNLVGEGFRGRHRVQALPSRLSARTASGPMKALRDRLQSFSAADVDGARAPADLLADPLTALSSRHGGVVLRRGAECRCHAKGRG